MNKTLKIAALLALGLSALVAKAETYALCIGINDYPNVTDASGNPARDERGNPVDLDLKGCVNDANGIRDALVKNYSVKPENVRVLLDAKANSEGFIENMKWLLSTAKAGDQVIFFYSGHGAQVKSEDPSETDGLDEVIVLADRKLVPDKFFGQLKNNLVRAGINATFMFDSCFGGGMTRDPQKRYKSFFTLKDMKDGGRSQGFTKVTADQWRGVRGSIKQAQTPLRGSYAFLTGGQENQPTIDISGVKDIPPHGVFTLFILAAIEDNPAFTMDELLQVTRTILKDLKFDQIPFAEWSTPERAKLPIVLKS